MLDNQKSITDQFINKFVIAKEKVKKVKKINNE
jgi:hypothetical protein